MLGHSNLSFYHLKHVRGLIMGIWNSHTSIGNVLGNTITGAFVEVSDDIFGGKSPKFNLSKILRSMTSIGKKREERYVYGTNYFGNKIETPIKDYRL